MTKDENPHARIVSRKQVFKRFFSVEVVEAAPRSLKHDGYGVVIEREVMRIGPIAAILLYCPETDEILLNQQFRMGTFLYGEDPFLYECAAGLIDEGEDPEQAARREAEEETGSTVTDILPIGVSYSSPGALNEKVYMFMGRIENPRAGHHGVEEEGEEIRTHLLPASTVISMLDDGIIRNSFAMLTVHWFARNHDMLKKKWRKA